MQIGNPMAAADPHARSGCPEDLRGETTLPDDKGPGTGVPGPLSWVIGERAAR